MDILQYIAIKYKDIIISFSYGDSPPHRSSSLPTPPLFTSITLVSPPPSFLLSLSVLLCLSVTDTLFLFFSIKDETFPPAWRSEYFVFANGRGIHALTLRYILIIPPVKNMKERNPLLVKRFWIGTRLLFEGAERIKKKRKFCWIRAVCGLKTTDS